MADKPDLAKRRAPPEDSPALQSTLACENGADDIPAPEAVITRIGPLVYLRSVWAIIWGAFRHPFSTTLVDLSTGASVHISARD
jgi:hypothetical protein